MPRRKTMPLDEMPMPQKQPRSRHPHSSAIQKGEGLYAGQGLYAGAGLVRNAIDDVEKLGTALKKHHHHNHYQHKSLMGHKLVGYGLPPALQSQPYSTHYQWGVTLPPAYQQIVKGNGLY